MRFAERLPASTDRDDGRRRVSLPTPLSDRKWPSPATARTNAAPPPPEYVGNRKFVLSPVDRKSVTARVGAWLDEIATLASSYRQLAGLTSGDRATLLRRARYRLLLLYMAEADFRFDVEPEAVASRSCASATDGYQSVSYESVQEMRRFI
jgi:hypothetical protein